MSVSDSRPGGCEFDRRLRRTFFLAFLTSAEACEKNKRWLWKESCISTGVRKPGNMCVTNRHDTTLAGKVVLNLIQSTTASSFYAYVSLQNFEIDEIENNSRRQIQCC